MTVQGTNHVQKALGGAFDGPTDRRVEAFTESISFDRRLYAHDIAGSIAHAQMLAKVGLLTADECRQIVAGLEAIRHEIEQGRFEFRVELEDIHMHIERALIDRIGDVGRKLHTARSRNDQVSTDLRLWVREAIDQIDERLVELAAGVRRPLRRATPTCILPGYTHLQRAQPVLAAHYWLAYCEKFERDRERLADCRAPGERAAAWARRPWPARACRSTAQDVAPAAGLRRRGRQQPRRVERPRLRAGVRLRHGADRRAPEHLGRGVDPLVAPPSSASSSCRRRSAPARRSCRRRSIPTCWN